MNDLIKINENTKQAITTSLKIAEFFNKDHKNILRDVYDLQCSIEFRQLNFEQSYYINSQNKRQPCFNITKDGFVFLAMGFTGDKAAILKEAYIVEFNKMESQLSNIYSNLSKLDILKMALESEEQRIKLKKENQILLPKAQFADTVADSSESVSVGIFAKAIGTGQNRLFAFLKDNKYLMENNEPYQKYLDLGIFKIIEQAYKKHDKTMITFKTLITGKGQKYLCKKLSEAYKP